MVDALKPKKIIPIHTFHADEYTKLFGTNVKIVGDGDVLSVL